MAAFCAKNLIFLCCNCHKKIDSNENDYPATRLFEIKKQHEKWVRDSLEKACCEFGFAELEVLTKFLVNDNSISSNYDYNIISIKEKIDKNMLQDVEKYFMMGLTRCKTAEDSLNRNPDPTFANTISNNLANKYLELKAELSDNIEVFNALLEYASGYQSEFTYWAAGLSIITYFFEKCEVFEK